MPSKPLHRKRVRTYNVPGHVHFLTFSCHKRLPLLTDEKHLLWLGESVRKACERYRIALWAYVFMPEHVHLLVQPQDAVYDLSTFRKSLKQSSAKRAVNRMKRNASPLLEKLLVQERPGKWCYRFWQEGPGYDKNIWSLDMAVAKAMYCHRNPVARKLVQEPSAWRWSSYRWHERGCRNDEPLALDPWNEMLTDTQGGAALEKYDRLGCNASWMAWTCAEGSF